MSHYNAQRVREKADGRWLEIFQTFAPGLKLAIDRLGHHVPCPVHGGQDGFRLFADANERGGGICNTCGAKTNGLALLAWVNGWDFCRTVDTVGEYLFGQTLPMLSMSSNSKESVDNEQRDERCLAMIRDVWFRSMPIDTESSNASVKALVRYLRARSIDIDRLQKSIDSSVIRAVSRLPYWQQKGDDTRSIEGLYPAMVCRVSAPNGDFVTIHRTYLGWNGRKAWVSKPKKLMATPSDRTIVGGAIRMMAVHGDTLALAEGVETALSVAMSTDLPCWSVICANGLKTFEMPAELKKTVRRVVIYADHDKSEVGLVAAQTLAKRLRREGFRCQIRMPTMPNTDWNDVLREGGNIPR